MNYKNNNFYIEKIKADNLIKKYGSPIYCYSNKRLVDNIINFKNSFKSFNPLICFSVKSNYNSTILRIIKEHGLGADVVSDGEFIPKECNVVVLKHEGLRVLVERSD